MIEKGIMLQFGIVYLPMSFTFQFITMNLSNSKDLVDCLRTRRRELGLEYKRLLDEGSIMPWETCDVHHRAVLANVVAAEIMGVPQFPLALPSEGSTVAYAVTKNVAIVCERLPIFYKPICKVPEPCYN